MGYKLRLQFENGPFNLFKENRMVFIKMLKIVLHSFTAGVKVIRDLCSWLKAGVRRTGRVVQGGSPS